MDIAEMNYDMLEQIVNTLIVIANNQGVLREELQNIHSELQNINSSIEQISSSGIYNIQDVCEKLDTIDMSITSLETSLI